MTIESKWLDHWFGSYGILKSPKSKGKRSPRVEAPGLREALQNPITSESMIQPFWFNRHILYQTTKNLHEGIIRRPNCHGKLFRIWQEQRHGKCPACKLEVMERSAQVRSDPLLAHGKMCEWDELGKLI